MAFGLGGGGNVASKAATISEFIERPFAFASKAMRSRSPSGSRTMKRSCVWLGYGFLVMTGMISAMMLNRNDA